jgi:hypothetical protein
VVFPPERGLGHGAVPAQPTPVTPSQLLTLLPPRLPQLQEHPRCYPRLKPLMGGGAATQLRGVPRAPLTPRAHDIEDGIGPLPIGDPGATAPTSMAVHVHRQYGLEDRPEGLRDPVAGRPFIHRRPGPLPLLCSCRGQRPEYTINELFG